MQRRRRLAVCLSACPLQAGRNVRPTQRPCKPAIKRRGLAVAQSSLANQKIMEMQIGNDPPDVPRRGAVFSRRNMKAFDESLFCIDMSLPIAWIPCDMI